VTFFETPAKLRAWFEKNHDRADELWVGMYRRASGRPTVTWPEVVDQALCFGWIDGVRYGLDDASYANRLSPRKERSTWSAVNIKRAGELKTTGLMRPAGEAAFAARDEDRSGVYSYENRNRGLDAAQEKEFRAHPDAWEFFSAQPPSYRKTAAFWVISAKREETRARRLTALIEHSRKRERIPPLARP
jgi:uncharacterized protein YdeI (YjbR/CyaY-like superfamily)